MDILEQLSSAFKNGDIDTIPALKRLAAMNERKRSFSREQMIYIKMQLSKIYPEMQINKNIELQISKNLIISNPPEKIENYIFKKYTIQNPKWLENHYMGRWQGDTPKQLEIFEYENDQIILPAPCIEDIENQLNENNFKYTIKNNRNNIPIDIKFTGQLKDFQTKATTDMLKHDFGTLICSTGGGKTVMGLFIIAQRKQKTIIIVHTKDLANQWIDRIVSFLDTEKDEIGLIGNGKFKIGEKITVALVQSVYKKIDILENEFGMIIQDEAHRVPGRSMSEAVNGLNAKYKLGLTATPTRRDKLQQLIFWYVGDIRHKVKKSLLLKENHIVQPWFNMRKTKFNSSIDPNEYSKLIQELVADEDRNLLIAEDIIEHGKGKCNLIISDRKYHCYELQEIVQSLDPDIKSEVLVGDVKADERERIIKDVNEKQCNYLFATGQLIGEGFDCKELNTLFIASPIKFSGRIIQYIGRIMRPSPDDKRPIVYDYVDELLPVFIKSAKARIKVYGKENILEGL